MTEDKELIDRKRLRIRLSNLEKMGDSPGIDWDELDRVIDTLPIVDAVVLPCKVGDTAWFVGTNHVNRLKAGVIETTVEKLVLKSGGVYMKLACNAMYETSCRSIGKTVFFSKEEAEAALAERAKGNE